MLEILVVVVLPQTAPPAGDAQARQLELGRQVYTLHCALCHGASGEGLGEREYITYARPRSFRSARFKLSTTKNRVPSDEDLARTIRRGMPGSGMPNWGWLTDEEIDALVRYVRQFGVEGLGAVLAEAVAAGRLSEETAAEILARRTVPGPPIEPPPEPELAPEAFERGLRIYLEACAPCHDRGPAGMSAGLKTDFEGNWLPPPTLAHGVFKGGSEGLQLYARIAMGMDGTAMPGFEGTYSGEELWDVVHFVQSLAQGGDALAALEVAMAASPLAGPAGSAPVATGEATASAPGSGRGVVWLGGGACVLALVLVTTLCLVRRRPPVRR